MSLPPQQAEMEMSPQQYAMLEAHGAPYPSTVAGIGGKPTVIPDIPVLAVFIALYLGSAIGNMTTFLLNKRKSHKFIINLPLFMFSMIRILTCSLRMGLATHSTNVSLSIAANIFLAAGILIVYIINLVLSHRILRAKQPRVGWSPLIGVLFRCFYGLVAVFLVLLITFLVYQSYTLESYWHKVSYDVQRAAGTYFVVISAAPLVMMAFSYALPASPDAQTFGKGSMATKCLVLTVSSLLCLLGAGFKCGSSWEPPRPISDPAWYQSKACLYVFYFALEILILYWFLATRIDQRFYVPDGSSKRKSYTPVELSERPTQASYPTSSEESLNKDAEKESDEV